MKVIITVKELMDKDIWHDFCEDNGLNPWGVNEGTINSDDEFTLTEEQAKKYGLLSD